MSLSAGNELDALIAERVMGWRSEEMECYGSTVTYWRDARGIREEDSSWSPSTSWDAAGQVVVIMRSKGYEFALIGDDREAQDYAAEFDKRDGNIGETTYIWGKRAPAAPLAICLAALDAIGYKEPE